MLRARDKDSRSAGGGVTFLNAAAIGVNVGCRVPARGGEGTSVERGGQGGGRGGARGRGLLNVEQGDEPFRGEEAEAGVLKPGVVRGRRAPGRAKVPFAVGPAREHVAKGVENRVKNRKSRVGGGDVEGGTISRRVRIGGAVKGGVVLCGEGGVVNGDYRKEGGVVEPGDIREVG